VQRRQHGGDAIEVRVQRGGPLRVGKECGHVGAW
jgi:hypothetical protein